MAAFGPDPVVQKLLNNPEKDFLDASEILLKMANNILNNPTEEKYRSVRIANATIMNKLLPVEGAMECLFAMGFQEDGEHLRLPPSMLLDDMTRIRNHIQAIRQSKVSPPPGGAAAPPVTPAPSTPAVASTPAPSIQRPDSAMLASEVQFYRKLHSSFEHVLMYEDLQLQRKAIECIPVDRLKKAGESRLAAIKTQSQGSVGIGLQDCVLLELINWYKSDFFSWVDAPPCDRCNSSCSNIGMVEPTVDDIRWGASRVEHYRCNACGQLVRFPRYNHPGRLLETRRGRCGEWANCFTLCCRSMGWEARYVLDWTDHVWTEVFSIAQNRWLHCDTCENGCDKPLLYETGWGKKLTYVIAFSKDDIQDVSWRYSAKHGEVLARRTECREAWLVDILIKMRKTRQNSLGEARRKILMDRVVTEMVEFMSPKTAGEEENVGRQSGSLAWRLARSETGPAAAELCKSTVLSLAPTERNSKQFHLKYCCASDSYVRVSSSGEESKGWNSLVFEAENVIRKVEADWKMAYLARSEGSTTAKISWKLDFSDYDLCMDEVSILVESKTFENGRISWRLCAGDDQCFMLNGGSQVQVFRELGGCKTLTLTAELSQGKDTLAWQHTQLFRQASDDPSRFPFDVKITFT